MGFVIAGLIFTVIGTLASLYTRVFCNRGPSTNLFLILISFYFFYFLILLFILFHLKCMRFPYVETYLKMTELAQLKKV
ncbi:hypothetical protein ACJRO7_026443 [Eucalyptus globulus]|uniref:Transmembrane protein n=1 Tax=Eucalyptus globulus TaxID=34317 RepID=A0ABD3JND7_EUCGL